MKKSGEEKIDIVMLNMSTENDWQKGIVNRNFYILDSLVKDSRVNKILSVDFFPMNFKKAIAHYYKNIIKGVPTAEMIFGDLTSACYQKSSKVYIYSSIDSLFSWKIVARELRKIIEKLNLKNIVLWSYNPFFVNFVGKLREELFVFDTVDNWTKHTQYLKLMKKEKLHANYITISQKADLIFTVSQELITFYEQINRKDNIYWVPNGVDIENFKDLQKVNQSTILDEVKEKIIGYLGTINSDRLDFDLIEKIVCAHPDKKIALIGPIWKDARKKIKKLENYPNVLITDRIKRSLAPAYLNRFDVAIIPHKINDFIFSTDPMKMYDYLASGLPIVATPGAGLSSFKDFIYITKDAKDFNFYITKAINEKSLSEQEARKRAVEIHSWPNKTSFMIEKIMEKINLKKI